MHNFNTPLTAWIFHGVLCAVVQCYAPYTRCYSGAALITMSGQVFSGGYIESAAYNPSMSPFHSAVVDGVTHFGLPTYDQVRLRRTRIAADIGRQVASRKSSSSPLRRRDDASLQAALLKSCMVGREEVVVSRLSWMSGCRIRRATTPTDDTVRVHACGLLAYGIHPTKEIESEEVEADGREPEVVPTEISMELS
jgi:hypothetical protein